MIQTISFVYGSEYVTADNRGLLLGLFNGESVPRDREEEQVARRCDKGGLNSHLSEVSKHIVEQSCLGRQERPERSLLQIDLEQEADKVRSETLSAVKRTLGTFEP